MSAPPSLQEARPFLETQGEVEILHRSAACSLAKVVEPCSHDARALVVVAVDEDLELVGVIQRVGAQEGIPLEQALLCPLRITQRHDTDKLGVRIMLRECSVNRSAGFGGTFDKVAVVVDGYGHDHPLGKGADGWQEDGRPFEARVHAHLRQMLVIQVEAIRPPGLVRIRTLEDADERLAATRVAGYGTGHKRRRRLQHSGIDERCSHRNEARGVAARVGDALGRRDALALLRAQLGKPVRPVWVGAMRSARIDQHGPIVVCLDERSGLDGRCIRQAQDNGIGRVDGISASISILALVFGQSDEIDITAWAQSVAHLEASRSSFAVDKNTSTHRCSCRARSSSRQTPSGGRREGSRHAEERRDHFVGEER
mmetsp:Transcript_43481/g.114263  ORF Transcript_43481/g.114263 Transcript_43481/m.114263 type:complete len:370 (+) Transcript_43481:294-1403(+)